jgi:hypothetical protein
LQFYPYVAEGGNMTEKEKEKTRKGLGRSMNKT